MHVLPGEVAKSIEPGDNILLTCPSMETDASGACMDLLTLADPAHKNVLWVSFMRSLTDHFVTWNKYAETAPRNATVIDVAAETRSAASPTPANDPVGTTSIDPRVERVSTPSDFTTLGVRIMDCLDAWDVTEDDTQTVLCFESITALLQYADRERTFKFLHALTDQCSTADVIAHYHLDPTAHDETTIKILTELFDVICAYEAGEWTIQTDV